MNENDLRFRPHSDMTLDDREIVTQHQNLINNGQFNDATALLDNQNYNKGFRASIFNDMQNKVRTIQEYLLDKDVEVVQDEVISQTQPTGSGSMFWIKDC